MTGVREFADGLKLGLSDEALDRLCDGLPEEKAIALLDRLVVDDGKRDDGTAHMGSDTDRVGTNIRVVGARPRHQIHVDPVGKADRSRDDRRTHGAADKMASSQSRRVFAVFSFGLIDVGFLTHRSYEFTCERRSATLPG